MGPKSGSAYTLTRTSEKLCSGHAKAKLPDSLHVATYIYSDGCFMWKIDDVPECLISWLVYRHDCIMVLGEVV